MKETQELALIMKMSGFMKTTKKPQKDDYNININKSAMDSTFIETEEIKI